MTEATEELNEIMGLMGEWRRDADLYGDGSLAARMNKKELESRIAALLGRRDRMREALQEVLDSHTTARLNGEEVERARAAVQKARAALSEQP